MQNARQSGAAVIRTWFFQAYYDMSKEGGRWHQIAPTWIAFDRILTAAAAHRLMVIPVLVNEWPSCEPGSSNKDIGFYRTGYVHAGYGYPLSFKRYATTVARHYTNNTTIAFWQLGNELEVYSSRGCEEGQSARALRAFADDTTTAVKAADPHHLVSLGTIGFDQCGLVGSDYQYVHAGRVDLCDYHDYGVATQPFPDGPNSLAERAAQCASLHKPLFIGESGIPANVNDFGQSTGKITSTSLQLRAGFFDAKMTAAFSSGLVGYVIWEKQQDASNSPLNYYNGSYIVGPSDPTNYVTATLSRTFGAKPGLTRFGFEDGGFDGWHVVSGSHSMALSNSNGESWSGNRSLVLSLGTGARSAIAATSATRGAEGGSTITYHVYVPSFAPNALEAVPYVLDRLGHHPTAPSQNLLPGWNVVQWTIPRGSSVPLRSVGLEIDNRLRWKGPLLLDDVSW
jgi:mannan endo-1,4-beta-mannosidase